MRSDTRGEKEGGRRRRWSKKEVEEGGPEGSSEADKQNITARVTRKDPEEMKGLRLYLFVSLSLFLLFPFSSPISFKMEEGEEEEEKECTLLKHEWITKSRVHSFAPYRPRNPQKLYLSFSLSLSVRATMARIYQWRRGEPTFFALFTHPTGG